MNTPLEQFQLFPAYPLFCQFIDFSFTNFSATVSPITFFIVIISFYSAVDFFKLYNPILSSHVLLNLYNFVSGVSIQQTGDRGRPYISWGLTIFSIVLASNFLGLTIIGFTLTAQLSITVGLAFSSNFGLFILGFYLHGFRFLKFFVPSGIPVSPVPFMTITEIFSYSIRSVSLSVRLFANMMAGHTLSHTIGSFSIIPFWTYSHTYLASLSFMLLFAVSISEVAIAFLQAYIFPIPFCIYLNDSLVGGGH